MNSIGWRGIACAGSQFLKIQVPADRTKPKRLMDAAAYRSLLKLFCAGASVREIHQAHGL